MSIDVINGLDKWVLTSSTLGWMLMWLIASLENRDVDLKPLECFLLIPLKPSLKQFVCSCVGLMS